MVATTLALPIPEALDGKAIVAILDRYHRPADRWLFLAELRPSTGFAGGEARRVDAWAMHCWPSEGFTRTSYEVKVSRADFLRELKEPKKRRFGLLVSNHFYFVTPPGVAKVTEIPPECGLIEIHRDWVRERRVGSRQVGDWCLNWIVEAPHRDTPAPSWRFLASLARQIRDTPATAAQ